MSQFNPNQYEFLFEQKEGPRRTKPKRAVPTNAELKKGLEALIRKHGSVAAVPAAEAKKFLSRFQNHPLKRGMKLKGEGAANKAIKTLADKMKVSVAIKPTGAKPKAARGQMKLRGEYETAAEKRRAATAAAPAADDRPRGVQRRRGGGIEPLGTKQDKVSIGKDGKMRRHGPPQGPPAPAGLTAEKRTPAGRGMAKLGYSRPRRPSTAGKKSGTGAAKKAAASVKAAGKEAGKQVGKSALGRAGAGLGLRAIMPLLGGVPGMALLALSMLPVLGMSGKMGAKERSSQIKARKHQYDMQRIMAGQAAPTPMDKLLQSNRLSAIQRMRRGGEITGKPYQMSPELTGLLGESQSELMTRLKQMPGQERKINLEDVMNMNMAGGH